ncbi:MAG: hypothetical protein WCI18_07325 [Pseudomonadota bacterium]
MKSWHKPLVMSLTLVLAAYCGRSQVGSDKTTTKIAAETAKVTDPSAGATLSITKGPAAGTTVAFSPGSLEIDTSVYAEVVSMPNDFNISSVARSSPAISVSATSKGSSITTLSSPLAISVPVDTLSLTDWNLTTRSADNLCMFLKSGSDLFFWRKSALTLSTSSGKNFAKVLSTRVGVFQLVYCGSETLPGFVDATEAKLGVGKEHKITFDSALYGRGQAKLCIGVISGAKKTNSGEEKPEVSLGGKSVAINGGGKVTVGLSLDNSKLVTGGWAALVFVLLGESDTCGLETAGELSKASLKSKGIYAWGVRYEDLNTSIDGEVGDAKYPLLSTKANLSEVSGSGALPAGTHCLSLESTVESEMIHAEFEVTTNASGDLSEAYSFSVPKATSYKSRLQVGSSCGGDSSGTSSTSSYSIEFPNAAQPTLEIASMALSTQTASTYCVNIYESSAFSGNTPGSVSASPNVSWTNAALGPTATQLIIPSLGGISDMSVQPGCTGANIYLDNRVYTQDVAITLP